MKVFVVCQGESGEGAGPIAVFSTKRKAKAFIKRDHPEFKDPVEGLDNTWTSDKFGVDLISIQEFEVV